jgi:hypothetical protein
MKLKEQVLKSYLLLSLEHVNMLSTFKNKKVWLIQVNYYLALVCVCEMLILKWGVNVNQKYLKTFALEIKGISKQFSLTFRGPCVVIYSYNKSQQDALFLRFI